MAQFCVKGPQKGPPRCTLYGTLLCSVHLQSWFCGEGVWLKSVYSILCYSRDRHLRFVERDRTRFVKHVTYGIYRWSRHTESGDSLVLLDYDLCASALHILCNHMPSQRPFRFFPWSRRRVFWITMEGCKFCRDCEVMNVCSWMVMRVKDGVTRETG